MARRGWHVFPVHPRSKVPAIRDWENTATTDLDQIAAWWQRRPFNIGISTGPSGLLVIDLDPSHGVPAPDRWAGARQGTDVLIRLAADAAEPAPTDTFTVATPSGGRHLYFHQPDSAQLRNTQGKLGWRIDTRGHGGYILAAGSRGPAGRSYRVANAHPVVDLPCWLVRALTPSHPPPSRDTSDPAPPARAGGSIARAPRTQAYLRAVVEGERHAVTTAEIGYRHSTLLRAARRLGHWVGGGALDEADARTALTDAAARHLGVAGYTARQIDRDITDGLAYGAHRPRYVDNIASRPSKG
ncbi:bifunctional DNA primase/polymerase [Pseudonocardia abyssalis]|uniref:Bifunctional DNA primase/polymerase n=1 Tax=Pseudonocardia abyssalis TaxID=2792008 RepID=A0ABS6US12_9PSEU|nr:bifunctional DNA primase/polymerase [Pseudonocardia abyssalis]MBW0134972.1 bifunctional DNA primase/polymerase [Pseudonocardia abyssalis]